MIEVSEAIETIDASNKQAWDLVRSEPLVTLKMSRENYERAQEIGYDKGMAWALGNIGAASTWMSDYEMALDNCFKSLELLLAADDFKHACQIEYYLSIIFYFLGDFEKQMVHAQSSYDLAKKCNDAHGMANALNGIGTSLYTNNRNEEAIENLEKGLELARQVDDKSLVGRIYDGIGQAHFHLGEFKKALECKFQALELVRDTGIKQTESFALDGIGEIYTKLEDYSKALEYFQMSFDIRKKMGFKDGMAKTKIHMAETLSLAGDNLQSVQNYKDALNIGIELGSQEIIFKAHFGLSELYEDMGNLTLFVKHFKAYHTAKQEFSEEKEDKKIKAFELKGRLDQIQKEKEELEKKNALLETYFTDVQTLSSIGHEITSTLDIEGIFQIIYDRINSLMEATGIYIGICNYEENKLQVKLAIDEGKRDKYFEFSLDDRKLSNVAIKTGKPIHINDYQAEIHNYLEGGEALMHNAPESVIVIPLKVKEIIIGVVYAQSGTTNIFSKHHFNILNSFSSYIAIALDNAWLYEQMDNKVKERTEELEMTYENSKLLNKIGQDLISTLHFEDVFEKLYENVNELMDATVFGVRLIDREKNLIIYSYEYEKGKRLGYMEASLADMNNYSVVCAKNNKEILINDNEVEYNKYVEKIVVMDGDMPYSLIFCPLVNNNEVIGVISVQSFEKDAYNAYDMTIVKTLAQYTVLALQNSKRYEEMESEVAKRTSEITRTYENTKLLSQIGQNITSQLSVENIIRVAYDNINKLMNAEGFGIGIVNEKDRTLSFPGYIERGERLDGSLYNLDDKDRLACICFNKELDIIINDFDKEYNQYLDTYLEPQVGESVASLIYLPLRSKEKLIGVITVQSFKLNSYADYQVDMMRTIGVYTGIAIDNATLYENMEEIVKERTSEVVEQKEEIEQSYQTIKLVGQINKAISESITIESIVDSVYENVNTLMDATGFGVGVYNESRNVVIMKGYIEKGEKLADFEYELDDQRLAPYCFNNKKEIFISDYTVEYKNFISGIQAPVSGRDSTSIIYLPLFSKERIVGLLTVQSFEANAYSEYHMDILRGLAATVGAAIENAILYESLEEKVAERTKEVELQKEQIQQASENTRLLSEIGKEIASELSSEDIISKVYRSINGMMDASIFGIGVYRKEHEDLYFAGAIEEGEILGDFSYPIDADKTATNCFREGSEMVINNWSEEFQNYVSANYTAAQGKMPESTIYLPLVSKGNKIGVLTVQSITKNSYTEYHVNVLRTLSLYIASALENASLYEEMENRVKERTAEIEKAYEDTKLLSQISKTIVKSLEVESIISSVYENINTLLDATCFGIGIYDDSSNMIKMPGFIEDGKQLDNVNFDVADNNRLASYCFNNEKEVFISNFHEQYQDYVKDIAVPIQGEGTSSIVYIPLNTKEKVIGVITVQSYKVNAYNEYHMSILRSLATTIATAIDNALLYENLEEKVRERTIELYHQKEIIEEKNKHITDSIRYAKRIQDATLPSIGLVRSYLPDSFVLFKPKDIVSGDFYWVEQFNETVLFAVVDCTGHGVPGAFLSLIGHNSLNQIVNELGIYKPAEILYELDKIVYKTLQNNLEHTNIKDGMDMAICSLNLETKELEFAGAYNPLYLVRDGELQEIKGDKLAIGTGQKEERYNNAEIQLLPDDRIYLFSDGYADQFGGPKGKKFKYSQFKELLVQIHGKPMEAQHKLLNHYIDAWQGDLEQLDDVCIIGVKV